MLQNLYHWTIAWAATPQAEWALFLLALAESSFFPIPPDILLMAMAVSEAQRSLIFALICTAGSLAGGVIGYGIGKFGGQPLLQKFFKQKTIDRVEGLFNRYDAWTIAIAGFTPIPYKVFTIASGAFRINFKTFVAASLIGRGGRFFLLGILFYFWGAEIKVWIEQYFNYFSIGLVVLLVGGFLLLRLLKSRSHKDSADSLDGSSNPAPSEKAPSTP